MTTLAVTDQQRFYLHEGRALGSIEELFAELQIMDDYVYAHHVHNGRNDFAAWVGNSLGDRFLAKNIDLCRDRDQLLKLLFMNLFS